MCCAWPNDEDRGAGAPGCGLDCCRRLLTQKGGALGQGLQHELDGIRRGGGMEEDSDWALCCLLAVEVQI